MSRKELILSLGFVYSVGGRPDPVRCRGGDRRAKSDAGPGRSCYRRDSVCLCGRRGGSGQSLLDWCAARAGRRDPQIASEPQRRNGGGAYLENSPAAKSGIKPNDIIVKAGDKYIKDPGDLECVASAKETELTLVVLHGGKETAIKVTPTKRPQKCTASRSRGIAKKRSRNSKRP